MNQEILFELYVLRDDPETSAFADGLESLLRHHYREHTLLLTKKVFFDNGNSQQAQADGVFAIPALIKKTSSSIQHIVGDLTNEQALLLALRKVVAV